MILDEATLIPEVLFSSILALTNGMCPSAAAVGPRHSSLFHSLVLGYACTLCCRLGD